jgi:Fe-S-cluster-containing hydrogenase component 2
LLRELEAGEVEVLVVADANPAYDLPFASKSLETPRVTVALAREFDETARLADVVLPLAHYLEAWDDAEPAVGILSLVQPTVPLLRGGRTLRQVLARWQGDAREDREILADHWSEHVYPKLELGGGASTFRRFFERALHDGIVELPVTARLFGAFRWDAVRAPQESPGPDLALVLYSKLSMQDGAHAHNPWLQELPDPVTKITWDNYVCLSPARARALRLGEGDVVRLEVEGAPFELPVHVQLGQHDDVACVALGYGRLGTDRFSGIGPAWIGARPTVEPGATVGRNAALLLELAGGALRYEGRELVLQATGRNTALASTQDYHSQDLPSHLAMAGAESRRIARRTTLEAVGGGAAHAAHGSPSHVPDLWLHRLLGLRGRLPGGEQRAGGGQGRSPAQPRDALDAHRPLLRTTTDDVDVVHQPMMCQHCDNAPCEPSARCSRPCTASEGLNQQVYNRCVGTRYCANNCPYKVRRFNWFDYRARTGSRKLALNPDVTVRSRGVMEKCSSACSASRRRRSAGSAAGAPLADGADPDRPASSRARRGRSSSAT